MHNDTKTPGHADSPALARGLESSGGLTSNTRPEADSSGRSRRRRAVIVAIAVALLAGTGAAVASPIDQSESGGRYQATCLFWYDYEGIEQGSISLCGESYEGDYGSGGRVEAVRRVQTCDVDGSQCSDAYSEHYYGPADSGEFAMDIVAGTATFNIVLAGEDADDECAVQATAQARGTYSYDDPYPSVGAYANPQYPHVWARQGTSSYDVTVFPGGASAYVTQRDSAAVSRDAEGVGSVCAWIAGQEADYGYMWSYGDSSTYYSVSPPWYP